MIRFKRGSVTTQVRQWKFPDGCVGIDLQVGSERVDMVTAMISVNVVFGDEGFTINDDLMALAMTVDALKRHFPMAQMMLELPYIPYARQDAGEILYDIMQMNPYESLPEDEHGFKKGTFKVTVEWSPEE